MTFFSASFETVLLRYFLMMAVIVASFMIGYPVLAILSFPLFISAFTAVSFKKVKAKTNQQSLSKDAKEIKMINTAA
jgi:hypothetical protein